MILYMSLTIVQKGNAQEAVITTYSLKWQGRPRTEGVSLVCIGAHPLPQHPKLKWLHTGGTEDGVLTDLRLYLSVVGWKACRRVSDEDIPRMIAELEHFDFRNIDEPTHFGDFLAWLYKLVYLFVSLKWF